MNNKNIDVLIKRSFKAWLFFLTMCSIAFSCMDYEDYKPAEASAPVITSDKSSVVLSPKTANTEVLTLSWTPGNNGGTNASINYVLQLDKTGSNFAAPLEYELGRTTYSKKFTTTDLDAILLEMGYTPGTESGVEARVKSTPAVASAESTYSNALSVIITSFEPVTSTLYIIGDAAPNGWSADNASPMQANPDDLTVFTYEGLLKAGEFKLITTLGQFLPSYNKGATETALVYRTEDSQPDDKFVIPETGAYSITVDLFELDITIAKLDEPPYAQLWIVGDATPNGWNIDNPNEMTVDPSDPFVFTYYENLNAGEFKIPTSTGNWGADFYMPLVNEQDIALTGVQLVAGGNPDNKWRITEPGPYKITLNLRDLTIGIKQFTPYAQLWMVGDATPAGWNIDNPHPMLADAGDPNVFTYTGELIAGEFKIPLGTGNWGGDYFMPPANHPDIVVNTIMPMKFIKSGNPDNKWQIAQPGNYKITVNQLYETIIFQPQ